MADRPLRILVVGVGGQGVLVAAKVLGKAAAGAGMAVHVGQIHGMSQRGGSVESAIVIGDAHTSFIPAASADVVLGFEPLETLRALSRMSAGTRVAMSRGPVPLAAMSYRGEAYPSVEGIVAKVGAVAGDVVAFDADALVPRAGDLRGLNVVMLGVLQGLGWLPFGGEVLANAVDQQSPPHFLDSNHQAFALGQQLGAQRRRQPGQECSQS